MSVCTLSITNLHMFRLGYISTHSSDWELVYIETFLVNVPILYTLKTPGNQGVFGVFREYKMRIMARNSLIKFTKMRTCLENFFY